MPKLKDTVPKARIRIRDLTKDMKVRRGRIVWAILHVGIVQGVELEKKMRREHGRAWHQPFVDEHQQHNEKWFDQFPWVDFTNKDRRYITDLLKQLEQYLYIYIRYGMTVAQYKHQRWLRQNGG